MITNNQTDLLYYADTLKIKYPTFWKQFTEKLNQLDVNTYVLPNTRDVWCRDYMPIQIHNNKFVQFSYSPSYLQKEKDISNKSNVDEICNSIQLEVIKSNIILDGGNVVCSANKAIITDRVFSDNKNIPQKQLIEELYKLFEVDDLIFIPRQPFDLFGHADGMIRFLDNEMVLVNDFSSEKNFFRKSLHGVLAKHKLQTEVFSYAPSKDKNPEGVPSAKGTYINFLHVNDVLILPTFNLPDDDFALARLNSLFPKFKIVTINSDAIAIDGGVLNCIGWNVKFWKLILEDFGEYYIANN